MNISNLPGSASSGDPVRTLLEGPLHMADMAMQQTKTAMAMRLKTQEMAQAQEVVAMMTGVGSAVDIMV